MMRCRIADTWVDVNAGAVGYVLAEHEMRMFVSRTEER